MWVLRHNVAGANQHAYCPVPVLRLANGYSARHAALTAAKLEHRREVRRKERCEDHLCREPNTGGIGAAIDSGGDKDLVRHTV